MPKKKEPADKKLIELIIDAAEKKLANDIKVFDFGRNGRLADYVILCGAGSNPQLEAIEKEVDKTLIDYKIKGFRWQGQSASGWILLDLGSIVLHIMGKKERDYYKLEELWGQDAVIYHY